MNSERDFFVLKKEERETCNLVPTLQLVTTKGSCERVFTCWIFYQFFPVFIWAGSPCLCPLIYAAEAELGVSLRPPDYNCDRWSQGWPYLLTKHKVGHLSPCSICMFFACLKLFVMLFTLPLDIWEVFERVECCASKAHHKNILDNKGKISYLFLIFQF